MKIKIGIIGGSGFYEFLKGKEAFVRTPWGKPSDKILISEYFGKKIAFLPRHGKRHQYPPHKINYLANLFSFKKLGVERIIAPCTAGSLKPEIKPGHFVICDQFIDRTKLRADTFFNGPKIAHISPAQPYCPELRKIATESCQNLKIPFRKSGTVIVIEGPRFSTKAESRTFSKIADIINMTQYPEVVLARELEMCYLNISLVTDYDVGLKDREDIKSVSAQEVIKISQRNNKKVKEMILEMIKNIPDRRKCKCAQTLKEAIL
ncbi:S-methyl-5'-thioadenosine phosphorylase [Patescibacteria group bacterium]|nr:S-methyl-5'-thioadenosine phosphorylase [Patescibacteria group bacterium]